MIDASKSSEAETRRLTVAWNPREGDIHVHRQLLSSTPVDDDGRVDIDAPVVEELDRGEGNDDRGRNESHCVGYPPTNRLVFQAKRL